MTRQEAKWVVLATILTAIARAGTAAACDDHAYVRAELEPLPAALAGMRVEVHKTIAPQLVMENTTARTVEVLDDAGVPFLRIGPRGVEGNVNARAWYLTYSPGAMPPAVIAGSEPRWQRVRAEPAFGWFESRLDPARVPLPTAVVEERRAANVGRWEIGLRLDGSPAVLAGRFRYEPPADGRYVSRLTSGREIAPGVRVTLLPGQVPGLLVENSTPRPLLVIGTQGEPFLRIGPRGVEANVRSGTWWKSARSSERPPAVSDTDVVPDWQRVASVPRFSWVEPRASSREGTWHVPIQLGADRLTVSGVTQWRPRVHDANRRL